MGSSYTVSSALEELDEQVEQTDRTSESSSSPMAGASCSCTWRGLRRGDLRVEEVEEDRSWWPPWRSCRSYDDEYSDEERWLWLWWLLDFRRDLDDFERDELEEDRLP